MAVVVRPVTAATAALGAEVVAVLDAAERALAAPPDAHAAPVRWRP